MKKKAIIMSAFPALGKTWSTEKLNNEGYKVLDSDSSKFSWYYDLNGEKKLDENGKPIRNEKFPDNYIEYILANINDVDIIFISSHDSVRNKLKELGVNVYVAIPEITTQMKDELIDRMIKRGNSQEFINDQRENFFSRAEEMSISTYKDYQIFIKPNECIYDHIDKRLGLV